MAHRVLRARRGLDHLAESDDLPPFFWHEAQAKLEGDKSTYERLNAASKTIIIDAPVNHGNSGGPVVQLSRTNRLRIIGIATQFVPVPEDVLPLAPADAPASPTASSRTLLALGNSGYGVVASADAIIDLIAAF